MEIDWSFAWKIGGVGFGMVFALLIVLAVVVRLTGLAVNRRRCHLFYRIDEDGESHHSSGE